MDFQTRCKLYLQQIHRTRTNPDATPELSLLPHLQAFLEHIAVDSFRRELL